MPKPTANARPLSANVLPGHIAAHQAELATTPATNKARRERLEWQIRNLQNRLADVEARLT
jgi:hypothetical protein